MSFLELKTKMLKEKKILIFFHYQNASYHYENILTRVHTHVCGVQRMSRRNWFFFSKMGSWK